MLWEKRIFENVSQEAWNMWTKHQTMLINENRLSLADPRAREYLAQQIWVFVDMLVAYSWVYILIYFVLKMAFVL